MAEHSRQVWINGAFDLLREVGIDGLGVEPLAARVKLTKGSFYHHFANRRALHLAMLDAWERLGTNAIIETVEGEADKPEARLRVLLGLAFVADPDDDAVEGAIRSWAAVDEVAAEATARVDRRRITYVVDLLKSAGLPPAMARRRAHLMYRALVGHQAWRAAGGPVSTKRELDDLAALLMSRP